MKRVLAGMLACAGFVAAFSLCNNPAAAELVKPKAIEHSIPYMRVFGSVAAPYGFVQFCDRQPRECAAGATEENRFVATAARLAELDEVNRWVNTAIAPVTDVELYGVEEFWTVPAAKGDCEDYALLKRQLLIKRGWPVSSLLVTVVKDDTGAGHAVLSARTAQGDFILDNKVAAVKLWHQTGYEFIMRQSYLHPRVWMSLDPRQATAPAALAGVRSNR